MLFPNFHFNSLLDTFGIMDIYDYFDYRRYLADYYSYKKAHSRSFSYRAFAQRAGYTSSGLYIDLVKGKKNLTPSLVEKFAKAMGLNEKEITYFALMIDFTHAEDYDLKQDIFDEMTQLMPNRARRISRNQRDYYLHWYHVVVRESLSVLKIDDTNIKELADFIYPKISIVQARKSLKLLNELRMIQQVDGYYRPIEITLRGSSEIDPILVRGFQRQMIEMASDALANIPPENRNISCVTFSISDEGLKRIKSKVDSFRNEILNIVRSDSGENRVAQFNVQFFPVTNKKG